MSGEESWGSPCFNGAPILLCTNPRCNLAVEPNRMSLPGGAGGAVVCSECREAMILAAFVVIERNPDWATLDSDVRHKASGGWYRAGDMIREARARRDRGAAPAAGGAA